MNCFNNKWRLLTGYKGLSLSDKPFVSLVEYTLLSSSNSSINILWECSSSCTNIEPLAICLLYGSFVDFLEGFDVPVIIKIDFVSLQATPTSILFLAISLSFFPFFVVSLLFTFVK